MTTGLHTVTITPPYRDPVTNRVPDPSGESGLAGGWASNNATLWAATWDTVTYRTGTRSLKTARTTTTPSAQIASVFLTPTSPTNAIAVKVTPGEVISIGVYARTDVTPANAMVQASWRDGAGALISTVSGPTAPIAAANTWQRLTFQNLTVTPANAATLVVIVILTKPTGVTVGGEQAWFDSLIVAAGSTTPDYFDGDTPGAYWTGQANRSPSIMPVRAGAGTPVDVSCLVEQIAITQGRADTTEQPAAATATIDVDLTDTMLPAGVEIGSTVHVTTTIGTGSPVDRFVGTLTDITLGWDDAGPATPDTGIGQLIATATLADLGRRVVGDTPWPQEIDGDRVTRILALAGMPADPTNVDPGTVTLLPRDVDATDALSLAGDVALSSGGVLWQDRAGVVRYADAMHRRNLPVTLDLDACQLLVTPSWSRTTQGLINDVSIAYGLPPPEGSEQPTYRAQSDTSIARYGRYGYSLTTQLAALADAAAMAGLLLARNASPVWVMAALPVDVKGLSDGDTVTLLTVDMHDLISLTGLPAIADTAPTSALLWVEGWTETLGWDAHDLELTVSGYCRTVPPPRWDDIPAATTWDTVAPATTWDSAACLGPPVEWDRWTDVPASARWDTTDPAITWDTWTI
jgi:hypothetical protein